MSVFYDLKKTPRDILNQAIVRAVASESNGVLFDPSDLSTLYQDADGTIPVTAVEQPVGKMLDKSGNGYHATQSITASRPTLSARKNILLATETLATQSITTLSATYTLSFTGTGSVTLLGTATGQLNGTGTDRVSLTFTPTAGTLTLTVSGNVTKAQVELGSIAGQYQRVNTSTDYDTDERYFPKFLRNDNVDDYFNLPTMNNQVTHAMNENGAVGAVAGTIMGASPTLRWLDRFYGMITAEGDLSEGLDRRIEYYLRRKSQTQLEIYSKGINDIGIAGQIGFGVGICPSLPIGYTELEGTNDLLSQNHGNYQYTDGSIQCWVPAFYARIGHASNLTYATYGINSVSILPISAFADVTAANAAGYFLPRCFIDGGTIKAGFFIDKYMCSNNGGIASSIKNGNPLSSAAGNNPFAGLTGAPSNTYAGAWPAAKTRGAAFFVTSRFMYAALALLSLAHGQAEISATNCAWYDATGVTNFPKGCNNNALKDANDAAVTYTSYGYSTCGKTGSGVPLSKTTHNGQACGVADLNGLLWEISQGVTCIAVGKTITAATQDNPVKLTMTAHGMTTGKEMMVTGIVGMTQLNDKIYKVTIVDANNVTLDGVDGTAFTAYTSGGTGTYGTFYVAKESAVMANFTGGNTLASDHFGAVGVAVSMDAFTPACFRTDYPNNAIAQKLGNGANQVLSAELTGNNAVLRSLGVPIAMGASSAGSNLFGRDYLYQYIRNELCLLSGARWLDGSGAGVWASIWSGPRTDSGTGVGFRSARYL